MPPLISYKCSDCDFCMPSSWEGGMYAVDGEGQRVRCCHPGELATAAEVLGITVAQLEDAMRYEDDPAASAGHPPPARELLELVKARVGYEVALVCFDCLATLTLDLKRDGRRCSQCGSSALHSGGSAIGKACPKCRVGVIRARSTGIMS